jgi:hypothetical protein
MRIKLPAFVLVSTATVVAALLWTGREPSTPRSAASSSFQDASPAAPAPDTTPPDSESVEGAESTRTAPPPDTIADILELPHDFSQTQAAFELAAAADATQLQALVAEARSIPSTNDRVALTRILVLRYAEIEPYAAVRYVERSTLESKPELIFTIFNSWSKLGLDAAISAAADLGSSLHRRAAGQAILAAFADSNVDALVDIAQRLAAIGIDDAVTSNLAARAAAADPEAALELASTIGSLDRREPALQAILTEWAQTDAEAAILALEGIEIRDLPNMRRKLGIAYARQSPAAAIEWGRDHGGEFGYMAVLGEVMRQDPARMIGILRTEYTPLQQQPIVDQVMQAMALEDPQAATDAWTQLPEEFRPGAASRIISIWAQRDPDGAEAWVRSLPKQDGQQEALRGLLIMMYSTTDDVRYAELVNMLNSAEDRDTYGSNHVGRLVQNGNIDAAERLLSRLSLSPEYYRRARESIDGVVR